MARSSRPRKKPATAGVFYAVVSKVGNSKARDAGADLQRAWPAG